MLTEQVTNMNAAEPSLSRAQSHTRFIQPFLRVTIAATISAIVLAGCAGQSGGRAPVNDLSQSGGSSSSGVAKTYLVKAGDTLTKVSRATGVDEGTIKRLNKLNAPYKLFIGQTLKLSDGTEAGAARPGPAVIAPGSKADAKPLDQASTSSVSSAPDATPTRAADAGVINWGWPAQGKVIQGFTANTKGIDIAGNAGDAIVAAANGKVMYSGNGVRGLGNLIIIDHNNGFITAYAHNKSLLVKTDQVVKKGAKIAEMGQSDASSVRLHFEVRRQGSPVDPMQYLPAK